jgi:hypothetical protein
MRMGTQAPIAEAGWRGVLAVAIALLFLAATVVGASAQQDPFPAGSVVRVANTDGQRLNLRGGPSAHQTVLAKLAPGETLTVTGASQQADGLRWVPVRTAGGQAGWVAANYIVLVASVPPTRTPTPMPTPAAASDAPPATDDHAEPKGRPVDVEAKVKFPELDGPEQEITVWVTRDGQPVQGAMVTLETRDGDDDEHFRQLDPTDEEGRTRRSFSVRHEKGTVEIQVEAVAPDGGEGRTIVTYFRR